MRYESLAKNGKTPEMAELYRKHRVRKDLARKQMRDDEKEAKENPDTVAVIQMDMMRSLIISL